jgi:hypothetical protein
MANVQVTACCAVVPSAFHWVQLPVKARFLNFPSSRVGQLLERLDQE